MYGIHLRPVTPKWTPTVVIKVTLGLDTCAWSRRWWERLQMVNGIVFVSKNSLANGLSESDVAGHNFGLFWVIRSFERAEK